MWNFIRLPNYNVELHLNFSFSPLLRGRRECETSGGVSSFRKCTHFAIIAVNFFSLHSTFCSVQFKLLAKLLIKRKYFSTPALNFCSWKLIVNSFSRESRKFKQLSYLHSKWTSQSLPSCRTAAKRWDSSSPQRRPAWEITEWLNIKIFPQEYLPKIWMYNPIWRDPSHGNGKPSRVREKPNGKQIRFNINVNSTTNWMINCLQMDSIWGNLLGRQFVDEPSSGAISEEWRISSFHRTFRHWAWKQVCSEGFCGWSEPTHTTPRECCCRTWNSYYRCCKWTAVSHLHALKTA